MSENRSNFFFAFGSQEYMDFIADFYRKKETINMFTLTILKQLKNPDLSPELRSKMLLYLLNLKEG
jgi:hypothetical protein